MEPVNRLEQIAMWFVHNADEMKKNHPTDYVTFVGLVNELHAQVERLDKIHARGDN